MPYLDQFDILIDIHSAAIENSEAFIICEPNSTVEKTAIYACALPQCFLQDHIGQLDKYSAGVFPERARCSRSVL